MEILELIMLALAFFVGCYLVARLISIAWFRTKRDFAKKHPTVTDDQPEKEKEHDAWQ